MKGRCFALKKTQIFNKTLAALLCVMLTLAFALPLQASAEGTAAGTPLKIGVFADRCPVFYPDPDTGEVIGIGADIMRTAAGEAGYAVIFMQVEEPTLKEALDNTAYDLVMPFGSAIDSASGRPTVITDSLLETPFTLVTYGKRDLTSFNNLRVGITRSLSGAAETIRQIYPGIIINVYETIPECVSALRSAKVDALLNNSYVWSYILQKPSYSDLVLQPSSMFSLDFCAGAIDTPDNRDLIKKLNRGIAKLDETKVHAIILDYSTRRLYHYDLSDYLHLYWAFALLCILFFASLAVIAVQKMRTVRKEQDELMKKLIYEDPLTGGLSMHGFRKRAEELLKEHPDTPYLILYANIKNFKFINDSLGKPAGDELLRYWADKINEILRENETMCRLEGDHFVMLRCIDDKVRLEQEYTEVINSVRTFFIDRGKENRVQICSGIYVLTPEDYRNIDLDHMIDLARVAEKRLRNTFKKEGFEFYNPDQWEKGKRNLDIISHLPVAMKSGEIQVWYQPQVNFDTGEIIGAEALCRWKHATLGWISPAEFIPALEETGMIHELDFFVWDKVCQDLHRWNEQGRRRSISVNLSRFDIMADKAIPEHFCELIKKYDLTPDQLRIEITETIYVEDPDVLISTTEKLRGYGFKVEMDDFGSGYSSLNMLKDVDVDRIKLDLHFLTTSGDPQKCRTIIRYVVKMIHSLGMEMIAEGVETDDQAKFLLSKKCAEMQGYYFYKPMSVDDFEQIGQKLPSHP